MALNFNQPLTDEQRRFNQTLLKNNNKPWGMLTDEGMQKEANKIVRHQRAMAAASPNASVGAGSKRASITPTDININNGFIGGGGAAKKLDTAQIASLDELLRSYDVIRDNAKKQAKLRQEEQRTSKDRERETEETKYQGKKVSALQDFAGAKTDTDLNTRETLENMMSSLSTLGLGGARALTRQIINAANKSNRKANATQAQNQQSLDSAWNEYDAGYKDDITKIDDQYKHDTGEAERVWGQNRQNTLNKKADVYNAADYTGEREATMAEARGLTDHIVNSPFMNPQYTGKSRAMATPELADYQQDIATYDTSNIGADATGLTPVAAGATPGTAPGNLAVKAVAVNDKDLGVKKKLEGVDPILGV